MLVTEAHKKEIAEFVGSQGDLYDNDQKDAAYKLIVEYIEQTDTAVLLGLVEIEEQKAISLLEILEKHLFNKFDDADKQSMVNAMNEYGGLFLRQQADALRQLHELKPTARCPVCGGEMVFIRGKYPKADKREICPTCTQERLEKINEISQASYGRAYKSNGL